jgi:hypothetical protein
MRKQLVALLLLAGFAGVFAAASDSLTVPFRVNCGDTVSSFTDVAGNFWHADTCFSGEKSGGRDSLKISDVGYGDTAVYRFERYGNSSASFNYTFTIKNGTYQVKLHFAETYSGVTDVGGRIFDVAINDSTVLTSFDPYAAAGGFNLPVIKTFNVKVTNGQLVIAFQNATVQNAQVNGIEILPSTAIRSDARSSQTMHTSAINRQSGSTAMYNVLGRRTAGNALTAKHAQGVYLTKNATSATSQVILK